MENGDTNNRIGRNKMASPAIHINTSTPTSYKTSAQEATSSEGQHQYDKEYTIKSNSLGEKLNGIDSITHNSPKVRSPEIQIYTGDLKWKLWDKTLISSIENEITGFNDPTTDRAYDIVDLTGKSREDNLEKSTDSNQDILYNELQSLNIGKKVGRPRKKQRQSNIFDFKCCRHKACFKKTAKKVPQRIPYERNRPRKKPVSKKTKKKEKRIL